MKIKRIQNTINYWSTVVCFLVCGSSVFGQSKYMLDKISDMESKMELVSEGKLIPNFTFLNIDGDTLDFYSFKGKTVIIDVWATWCSPCIKEAPIYDSLCSSNGNENYIFTSFSIDQDFETWKAYCLKKQSVVQHYWVGNSENSPIYWLTYEKRYIAGKERIITAVPQFVKVDSVSVIATKKMNVPSSGKFKL